MEQVNSNKVLMKRSHIHLIFTVIGVLATIGCSRISEPSFVSEYAITVTASFDKEPSKSTLLDGGKTIYWETHDEIKVFCGQESGRLVSTNVENTSTATFTGTISGGIRPFERNELYALYPYREDAFFENGEITTILPENQVAVKGSFDKNANIAIAVSKSTDLKFKNVCGGLRFTLTNTGVKRIELESNGSEYLAGEISLKFDGIIPSIADIKKGSKKVTLETEDGSAFEPGEWYYMTLLPCTLSDGYTVTISTDTKSAVLFVEKEQVVKRNTYGMLKDIDAGLSWAEEELQKSSFILQEGVKTMSKREVSSYVSGITKNGFNISDDAPASIIPNVGDVLFFETADASVPYMIGRVKDFVRTKSSGSSTVITEEVGIDDVFQEFSIGEQITMLDVPEITDDNGNVYECGLASPEIWDELTRPLSDTSSVSTEVDSLSQKSVCSSAYAAANKTRVPKYLRIANHIFNGNFYFDVDINYPEKITYKNGELRFVIDVELRGGIRGDIGYHGGATIIDLISKKMKWKVGYIGPPIGGIPIFIRPVLQVYFNGNATIGGDVQLELIHSSFTASNIPGRSKDYSPLPKDSYLTLKSLKADGSLGYKMGIGIENSIINENFLMLGIEVTGGTEGQIIGEFPSKDGMDLDKSLKFAHNGNINVDGYIEARINAFKPEERLDFPIFSHSFNTVEVDLLPLIKCISAKFNSLSNKVSIAAKANRQCFIRSSEGGYCIYKKGEKQPIEHKSMYHSASTKAFRQATSSNGLTFDVERGGEYEIAPYAIVNEGEYVYGDKILIDVPPCPDENHIHAIDLGLSVKWACCNVGATRPEEYGGYYAWGETTEKNVYDYYSYSHITWINSYCYWNNIGSDIKGTQYDVAHTKWGGNWRMPTESEFLELINNCILEPSTINGVEGQKFTSRLNGNSIFFPYGGMKDNDSYSGEGYQCVYWSSSLSGGNYNSNEEWANANAWGISFHKYGEPRYGTCARSFGFSVRPVSE